MTNLHQGSIPAAPLHSRADRRALKSFGKQSGSIVITSLVPHDAVLPAGTSAAIKRAVAGWRAATTRTCFVCSASHPPRDAGAILTAASQRTTDVAVSGCCSTCWRDRSADEIEGAAIALLRLAVVDGVFLDEGAAL